jgi:hypothetical protein
MTKNSSPKKKHPQKKHSRGRIFLALALITAAAIAATLMLVERRQLPQQIRDNGIVIQAYQQRDILTGTPPAAAESADTSAGYSGRERGKLDKLISKGAQDH